MMEEKYQKTKKTRTVTTDHIPVIVQNLDDKGMRGQLTSIGKTVVQCKDDNKPI